MSLNFLDTFLSFSVSVIPSVETPAGLGAPLYLSISDGSGTPDLSTNPTSVSSAADVAALLTGTEISAQAAADLTAMFSQSPAPPLVYLASYDTNATEDPSDAIATADAADLAFGPVVQESRTDANNALLGATLASTKYLRFPVFQSAEATLLTSGKPAALANCELETAIMAYHDDDTEPLAAAIAAKISALPMDVAPGPIALQQNVAGVALNTTTLTTAQEGFLRGNGAVSIMQRTSGAGATARDIRGTLSYGDQGWTGMATAVYAVKRMRVAIISLLGRHAVSGRPLLSTVVGRGEVRAALAGPLGEMANAGHFVAGQAGAPGSEVDLPNGFGIEVTSAGSVITAAVTILVGAEATALTLNVTVETEQ